MWTSVSPWEGGDGEADGTGPRAWWLVGENAAPSPAAAPAAAAPGGSLETLLQDVSLHEKKATAERTTWVRPALSRQMVGWDDTAALLRHTVAEHGPFDGVFGFSQGAATAGRYTWRYTAFPDCLLRLYPCTVHARRLLLSGLTRRSLSS
jgi:hypothetical protein